MCGCLEFSSSPSITCEMKDTTPMSLSVMCSTTYSTHHRVRFCYFSRSKKQLKYYAQYLVRTPCRISICENRARELTFCFTLFISSSVCTTTYACQCDESTDRHEPLCLRDVRGLVFRMTTSTLQRAVSASQSRPRLDVPRHTLLVTVLYD